MDMKKSPKTYPLNVTVLRMYEAGYSMDDIIAATGLTSKKINDRLYRSGRSTICKTPKSRKYIDRFKAEWETATGMIRPYL